MTKKELIDRLVSEFDFERVHHTMCALNWKWGMGQEMRVPTIGELVLTAMRLLGEVIPEEGEFEKVTYVSTGGFIAGVDTMEADKMKRYYLIFYVAESDITLDMARE